MKVLILNDLTYMKTMLTGMPINLGVKSTQADWDDFILVVVNSDMKLKESVLGFLPACESVEQFTVKLRESLILANPHGIFFVSKKLANYHYKTSTPKSLKQIIARCASLSSDENESDDEAMPPTPDQRAASPLPSTGGKRALEF